MKTIRVCLRAFQRSTACIDSSDTSIIDMSESLGKNKHESLVLCADAPQDITSVIVPVLELGSRRDTSTTLTSTNFIKAPA